MGEASVSVGTAVHEKIWTQRLVNLIDFEDVGALVERPRPVRENVICSFWQARRLMKERCEDAYPRSR